MAGGRHRGHDRNQSGPANRDPPGRGLRTALRGAALWLGRRTVHPGVARRRKHSGKTLCRTLDGISSRRHFKSPLQKRRNFPGLFGSVRPRTLAASNRRGPLWREAALLVQGVGGGFALVGAGPSHPSIGRGRICPGERRGDQTGCRRAKLPGRQPQTRVDRRPHRLLCVARIPAP